MRTAPVTDGRSHDALSGVAASQHHPAPESVSFNNTTQSLPPGTTYDLDTTLSHVNFKTARLLIYGPSVPHGPAARWKECAEITITTDSSESIAYSVRGSGTFKKVYASTYSKQNGATNLTHKIFDSSTPVGNRRIALLDAWISGSTLRLRFKNYFGGSATLWVKGSGLVY